MESENNQQQPNGQLPTSGLVESIQAPIRFLRNLEETLFHGRPPTDEEREIKRKQEIDRLMKRKMELYDRVLTPEERRKRELERAIVREEVKSTRLKLEAIQTEQRVTYERVKAAMEQAKALQEENNKLPGSRFTVTQEKLVKLSPKSGEYRTLKALKQVAPHGLTVKELIPLTKRDHYAEETSENSLYTWLNALRKWGFVRAGDGRPKKWFFVKDLES